MVCRTSDLENFVVCTVTVHHSTVEQCSPIQRWFEKEKLTLRNALLLTLLWLSSLHRQESGGLVLMITSSISAGWLFSRHFSALISSLVYLQGSHIFSSILGHLRISSNPWDKQVPSIYRSTQQDSVAPALEAISLGLSNRAQKMTWSVDHGIAVQQNSCSCGCLN